MYRRAMQWIDKHVAIHIRACIKDVETESASSFASITNVSANRGILQAKIKAMLENAFFAGFTCAAGIFATLLIGYTAIVYLVSILKHLKG